MAVKRVRIGHAVEFKCESPITIHTINRVAAHTATRNNAAMLEVVLKIIASYLLGSVMGGLVLGRLRGVDIRRQGSGNAGATNALRTQGVVFGLLVFVVDIGKGLLAVAWLPGVNPADLGLPSAPLPAALALGLPYACHSKWMCIPKGGLISSWF